LTVTANFTYGSVSAAVRTFAWVQINADSVLVPVAVEAVNISFL